MEDLRHRINQERVRWIEFLRYINTKIHKELERLDELEVALIKGSKDVDRVEKVISEIEEETEVTGLPETPEILEPNKGQGERDG